jgi:hypothetical protein
MIETASQFYSQRSAYFYRRRIVGLQDLTPYFLPFFLDWIPGIPSRIISGCPQLLKYLGWGLGKRRQEFLARPRIRLLVFKSPKKTIGGLFFGLVITDQKAQFGEGDFSDGRVQGQLPEVKRTAILAGIQPFLR